MLYFSADDDHRIAPDDYSAQLRSLRLILGQRFRPISTKGLAELIGIPLVSIRAVEAGRRKLNDVDRLNIGLLLGATWDGKSGEWIALSDRMPFTREKYERHQSYVMSAPEAEQLRAEYHRLIDLFLDRLELQKRHLAVTKLSLGLQRLAQENNVNLGEKGRKKKNAKAGLKPRRGSSQKRNHLLAGSRRI